MESYVIRGTAAEGQIRAFAIDGTALVTEAQQRHHTWPVATAALGRTLMATAMLGFTLKNEDSLTVRINGDGPLGGIVCSAGPDGKVRGYVLHPDIEVQNLAPGKLNVGMAVGKGHLTVVKDMGLKEPYTGISELVSGEIGDDFTYYLTTSEQVPSAVGLGVLVNVDGTVLAAGGFMVQLMPGIDEAIIAAIEANLKAMPPISNLIETKHKPLDILNIVLQGLNYKVLEEQAVQFVCPCSKERLEPILISLGKKELNSMIEEQQGAELKCHFCGEVHQFKAAELQRLVEEG